MFKLRSLTGAFCICVFACAGACFSAYAETSDAPGASEFELITADNGQELQIDLRDALNDMPPANVNISPADDDSKDAELETKDYGMVIGSEEEMGFSKFMKSKGYGRVLFEGHWHWADQAGMPMSVDSLQSELRSFLLTD